MYQANWKSLQAYEVPEWFKDAKLGIFIHWGIYSVPAWNNEWYPRFMYRDEESSKGLNYYAHHCETWGHPGEFGYKDFIPMFKGEQWDPETWVNLFIQAGAKYIVPVGEHHDGFPMYKSKYTPWNAAEMGPCRDVVAELGETVRGHGLKFGVSSHRAFNWRYFTYRDDFDNSDPANAGIYSMRHSEGARAPQEWVEDWFRRTKEMIDRFQPDVIWFDFGWHEEEFASFRPQVCAYLYNQALHWGKEVVLQYKDKIPEGVAVYDVERGKLNDIRRNYWQTDTAVSYKSWSYIEDDEFKSVTTLVHDLVDIVSKNGNLLLNVGPRSDGVIPDEAANLLRGLGKWLQVNGEAIYNTRHWDCYGEGPTGMEEGHLSERSNQTMTAQDIRYTQTPQALYATMLGWPGNEIKMTSLSPDAFDASQVTCVALLGIDLSLEWKQIHDGLTVTLPKEPPVSGHAYVVKFALAGS